MLLWEQYSCGVVLVFWFWREIVFDVMYILIVQYICAVVSFFWLWREIVLKMRTQFIKKILLGYFIKIQNQCEYIRSNTLLHCNFLFCIFLLYRTDLQVEVQIRILLKDKYVKSCQNGNTGNHTLISWTMLIGFFLFKRNNLLAKICFS